MTTYKLITDRLNTYFTNNKITVGAAAPTSGTHAAGDIVLSSSANSTAFGWICTSAGTPGTWKVLKSGGDVTSVSGNAGTATKFASAQSVALTGDVTGSASSQAGWSVATTLANSGVTAGSYGPSAAASPAHGGTFSVPYITVDAKGRVTSASTKTITLPSSGNTDTKVTNTLATTTKAYVTGTTTASTNTGTQVFDTGVYLDTTAGQLTATTFKGALSGNASTATKFASAQSVALTGDVTGSASSQAGWSVATTLANSGVTAGSYGPSAAASPAHGGTFSVPYITVDAKGRVTSASTKTITLPSDNNTDTKVTNTLATTTKAYVTGTTSSSTNTGTQVFDTGVYLDTTAGQLTATTFKGALSGNASTATTLQTARTINGTSFNGSANITTANWGTARTITIGSTGKSVNGSGNVSWSLSEIGAAASSHTHSYLPLSGGTMTGNLNMGGKYIVGETIFTDSSSTTYADPWENQLCAIKATGNIACTGSMKAITYNFGSNSSDTDDFAYITSNKSGYRTTMDFYVGNDFYLEGETEGANGYGSDDRFVWHLPYYPDIHSEELETMQLYNWWMIGGYGTLCVADVNAYSSVSADYFYTSNTDNRINGVGPYENNVSSNTLGTSARRYYDVYCNRGAFNGSDSKLKDDIKNISRNGILNNDVQIMSDEEVENNVTSAELYDYVKNSSLYSYKYKSVNNDAEDDYYVGIMADNIPDNIFNLIGHYTKTEEEYQKELEERPAIIERYNELVEAGVYSSKKPGVRDQVFGMGINELKERALNEPEEPMRLINAPAQVAMLQEVLSIALNKIEALEAKIAELESN